MGQALSGSHTLCVKNSLQGSLYSCQHFMSHIKALAQPNFSRNFLRTSPSLVQLCRIGWSRRSGGGWRCDGERRGLLRCHRLQLLGWGGWWLAHWGR